VPFDEFTPVCAVVDDDGFVEAFSGDCVVPEDLGSAAARSTSLDVFLEIVDRDDVDGHC